ncbi:MAG: aminotransferase class V-fold PLP-dependent enzyme [Deltaproteobacteria bacterium]|nr:aminotransferase class V-fold PLP-dependent enzyme [Deltaproteobacteria bacterium]
MIYWTRTVYLDHNATTPLADEVCDAMVRAMEHTHGNASSLHTAGREARGLIDQARMSVASAIGCDPGQILFTSGGTEANNTVIQGVFAAAGKGHVITSRIEHESVLGACQRVIALGGEVTFLDAGSDGRVRVEDVRAAIRPDTILISIMHANNETGAIQPIEELASVAAQAGIALHTDAVQSVGKIPVQVDALGCEFLTLTAHKIRGPKGVGAIYWRGKTPWIPLVHGGDQERGLRPGTEAAHQIVGLGAAIDLAMRRMDDDSARLRRLRGKLIEGIRSVWPESRIHEAPEGSQVPGTVNVAFCGKEGIRVLAGLDCHLVSVSIGSACTADRIEPSHVLIGMGISTEEALSSIRMSMGATTSAKDVDYVLKVLREVLQNDPEGFGYMDPQHLTEERIRSEHSFLIDLRMPFERLVRPSLPGAKEWSYVGFERRMPQVPRDKEAILICSTGILSMAMGYRLARSGHPKVRVIYGGYDAWHAQYPKLLAKLRQKRDAGEQGA